MRTIVRYRCVVAAMVVVALLGACSPSEPAPVTTQPPASTGPAVSSQTSTPPEHQVLKEPTPVEVDWQSVLTMDYTDAEFDLKSYTDGAFVAQTIRMTDPVTFAEASTVTYTAKDGTVSTLERGDKGFLQEAMVWGKDVLFLASIDRGWQGDLQWELWTPGEQDSRPVEGIKKGETLTEAVIADGMLYYVIADDESGCLYSGERDGDGVTRQLVACLDEGEERFMDLSSDGHSVSWLVETKDRTTPNNKEVLCNKLYRLLAGSEDPEEVSGADCVMNGVAGAEVAVWSDPEVPDKDGAQGYDENPMHVTDFATVTDVGIGSTTSEITCGGMVFWNSSHRGMGADFEHDHIRAWSPEQGMLALSVPQGTGDELDHLHDVDCINDTTIGVSRSNNNVRVHDYFIADISTLKAS